MEDMRTISSDEIIALSRAIDAATDRGDLDEASRLASMSWEEVRRWLDAHGYPQRGDAQQQDKDRAGRQRRRAWPCLGGACLPGLAVVRSRQGPGPVPRRAAAWGGLRAMRDLTVAR
jgi:hypothetical protein